MTVQPLCGSPSPELTLALMAFEAQFTYPLGPGRFFRIDHGADYPRFFRAMGEAASFIAEENGQVLGTLGATLRHLLLPDGQEQAAIYLGDLKIAPPARGGRLLWRLAQAVQQWVGSRAVTAFCVVMDGTPATPERYTGRLGVPSFRELGNVAVLRLRTAPAPAASESLLMTTAVRGSACYRRLSVGRFGCPGGNPAERSEMAPRWLVPADGRACGRLEDTRRAKRLITGDGAEMRCAHLSCFAYEDVRAGVALLEVALCHAAGRGFPDLFVAVPAPEAEPVCSSLAGRDIVVAPATVFGAGLEPGALWNINTAEI